MNLFEHKDECDKIMYGEEGTCTCDLIDEYGDDYDQDDM